MIEDRFSTDLAGAAYLAREADPYDEPEDRLSQAEYAALQDDRSERRRLNAEAAYDPCEDGDHPDAEDGRCLACGEWLPPYDA